MKKQPKGTWRPRKLDELGIVARGRSRHRPRNAPELYGGPYPFFQTGDIKAADLYLRNFEQTYSDVGLAQSKLWQSGTLCITIAANIAETAILGVPGCFPDSVVGFIANDEEADTRFVKYYIDTIKLSMQNVSKGTTQDNLSVDKLLSFDFLTPDITTQRKIAGVLSAYDDLIENNTRRIAILEEMAQAIYREWFVNFRFPEHDKVKLIDSPLGKIPEGWKPHRLGDLAREVRRGVDPTQLDPDTPYFGLEHLPRRSITLGDWGTARDVQSTKLAFKKGEILFGKIRPYFHKVGVAPVDGVCSTDAIVIVPNTPAAFGPVVCCVSSDDFVRHATQTSQGTKMPRANWDVLVKYPLPIPPDGLLNKFNDIIADAIGNLRLLMLKNRNLRNTRDLLLPKLISGQLDVEDLDIDTGEPLVEIEA